MSDATSHIYPTEHPCKKKIHHTCLQIRTQAKYPRSLKGKTYSEQLFPVQGTKLLIRRVAGGEIMSRALQRRGRGRSRRDDSAAHYPRNTPTWCPHATHLGLVQSHRRRSQLESRRWMMMRNQALVRGSNTTVLAPCHYCCRIRRGLVPDQCRHEKRSPLVVAVAAQLSDRMKTTVDHR